MDFSTLSKKRRSIRNYIDKKVDRVLIYQCLAAALMAPSARNYQPWKFIVIDEEHILCKVKACTSDDDYHVNIFTRTAPIMIAVVNEGLNYIPINRGKIKGDDYTKSDIGGAIAMFCLKATELSLGTCIIGAFDAQGVKKILGIPEDRKLDLIITVGYPANEKIAAKVSKEKENTISYNKY
ncbi:nitroreductase family protein [Clostridium gelidum]|nr:nitroreductase family protein [Clostridium gelidum]